MSNVRIYIKYLVILPFEVREEGDEMLLGEKEVSCACIFCILLPCGRDLTGLRVHTRAALALQVHSLLKIQNIADISV